MEGVLALATILRDWRITLPAGREKTLDITPRITLRPKGGLFLHLEKYPVSPTER
jgi:hypothetical protein